MVLRHLRSHGLVRSCGRFRSSALCKYRAHTQCCHRCESEHLSSDFHLVSPLAVRGPFLGFRRYTQLAATWIPKGEWNRDLVQFLCVRSIFELGSRQQLRHSQNCRPGSVAILNLTTNSPHCRQAWVSTL